MKNHVMLLLITFLLISCKDHHRTIEVYGTGEIKAVPEYVDIKFNISNIHTNPEFSQQINMSKSSAVIKSLKEAGIKESNIFSIDYTLSPEYRNINDTQTFIGYKSTNSLIVRITDINNYKHILSKILTSGVNEIDSINFGINNYQEFKAKSLSLAVLNAKEKAKSLVEPIKQSVAQPIDIIELDSDFDARVERKSGLLSFRTKYREEANIEIISKGERYIVTNVFVRFELK